MLALSVSTCMVSIGTVELVRAVPLHMLVPSDAMQATCRLKWVSGQPFAGRYDALPTTTNQTQFLRIDGNSLVIDCKK